ncbi:MAG: hypothetical protein CMB32_04335 [Euryarchaeota archaeon]|nr:hypothetical protein [Euryarchaeota archaeon]
MIRFSNIATFFLLYTGIGICAVAQPDLTHVDNVNAAGNATLYWEVFAPVGAEEFVHNEVKVFDMSMNLLSPTPHIIGPDVNTGVLPTGWVMPSFLYNANSFAHCYSAEQITTLDGGVTLDSSPSSPTLCSIHVNAVESVSNPGNIDLEWNSPYAMSGFAAGGDFYLEKLNEVTAVWDTIAVVPDNVLGGTYSDNPGPCASIHIYRVRQIANNGIDINVSNATDLVTGAGNNTVPTVTHVDVDPTSGLAVVHFDYEVTDETLGYIIYKCTNSGSAEVLQIGDPNTLSASIPTSLASTEPESYRVAAFDCINDDGTPNPNAAGDCSSTVFATASQIPCTDRAQLNWIEPFGMDGGVSTYTIEYSIFDDASGLWSSWMQAEVLDAGYGSYLHEGVDVAKTYRYRVVAESTTGNIAHSNNFEISFSYPDAPENPVISRASVIDDGSVEIVVDTDPLSTEVCSYQIERYFDINNSWIPVLEPQLSSLGISLTFVDSSVDTNAGSHTYRCIVTNECGAQVGESNVGKTIFLQGWRSEDPEAFLNSLIWSHYEGFPLGVGSYELLRSSTRYDVAEPLASYPWNQNYADDYVGELLEEPGDFCYTVVALENSSVGLNGAKSNRVCLTEEPLIWIPTAFSPNGDDVNDLFPWSPGNTQLGFVSDSIPGNIPVFEMTIISRWGDTIFQSIDKDHCWDGTANGNPVPDGTYTAVIRILDGAGKWHIVSQSVQVVRP